MVVLSRCLSEFLNGDLRGYCKRETSRIQVCVMSGALHGCSCLFVNGFWYISVQKLRAGGHILPTGVTQSLFLLQDVKKALGTTALHGVKNLLIFPHVVTGSEVSAASKQRGLGAPTSAQSLLVAMLKIIKRTENTLRLLFKCMVFLHLD